MSVCGVTDRYGSKRSSGHMSFGKLIAALVGIAMLIGLPIGYDRYREGRLEAQVMSHNLVDQRERDKIESRVEKQVEDLKNDMNRQFDKLDQHLVYIRGRIDAASEAEKKPSR